MKRQAKVETPITNKPVRVDPSAGSISVRVAVPIRDNATPKSTCLQFIGGEDTNKNLGFLAEINVDQLKQALVNALKKALSGRHRHKEMLTYFYETINVDIVPSTYWDTNVCRLEVSCGYDKSPTLNSDDLVVYLEYEKDDGTRGRAGIVAIELLEYLG